MRDAAVPAFLAFACAAAGVLSGLLPRGPLSSTPESYLATLGVGLAAWLAICAPATTAARPRLLLDVALAAVPFFWLGVATSPVPPAIPLLALAAFAAIGLLATATPVAHRPVLAFVALAALAGPPILAGIGIARPSPALRVLPARDATETALRAEDDRAPAVPESDLVARPWRTAGPATAALRPGALARTPPATSWDGPRPPAAGGRWMPVPAAAAAGLPSREAVVALLGTGGFPKEAGGVTYVERSSLPASALDLDAFDALVVLPGAEDAGDADVLASFARRGGLLVGPAHADWPGEALARRLGPAGDSVDERGPSGARSVGLGRVARAGTKEDVAALLEAGLHRPPLSTAFDRARAAPTVPAAWSRWKDDPGSRRDAALLAFFFAIGATAASLWRGLRGTLGLATLAALACLGIGGLVESPAPVVAHPFAIDLGGEGGRRVEGVFLSAGPAGWRCPEGLRSEKGLRVLGFGTVRESDRLVLRLPPGGEGWLVEEGPAVGSGPGLTRVGRPPAWADSLLRRDGEGGAPWRWWQGNADYAGPLAGSLPGLAQAEVVVGVP